MSGRVMLLGFTEAPFADAVAQAMRDRARGEIFMLIQGGVGALYQPAVAARGATRAALHQLNATQRRLEAACLCAPFLPADPAQAQAQAGDIAPLLAMAAPAIADSLRGPGRLHQWDVLLRWEAGPVLASCRGEIAAAAARAGGGKPALAAAVADVLAREKARRAAALHAALCGVAGALLGGEAGDTEALCTLALPAGQEARIEAALNALPDDVTAGAQADLRGPMPPVSFARVRIEQGQAAEIAEAWQALALPTAIDPAALRRHFHAAARRLHPDLGPRPAAPMAQAGAAYRLLYRALQGAAPGPRSLAGVQRLAARRLAVQLTGLGQAA